MDIIKFTEKKKKYLLFYLGLVLILFGLSRIENSVATIIAGTLMTFLVSRIMIIPIQFILYKLKKESNKKIFGINNASFFGWLTFIFLILSVYTLIFFPLMSITKSCIFFTLACADATLASQ